MTNISREIIGSFVVTTGDGSRRNVIVSQNKTSIYNKDKSFNGKYFNLDRINGPEVNKTKDPKIFKLSDGTELFKRGNIQLIDNQISLQ